jgi:peptidoglycan/xylan/chitin deacetylase (PgdA/CDA1 family)
MDSVMTSVSLSRVPILMYHEISESPETTSHLSVSPAAFAEQLSYLHNAGFKTITAGALSAMLVGDYRDLPTRTVVLTFDDGYQDFYTRAMPLLDQHGFTATVFVTTGWVQDAGTHLTRKRPGRMLSWSQVIDATLAGIEVGAHSHQHPQLDQLPAKLLQKELYCSKELLEDKLGISVPGLAYPYGYSNAMVRQVAREADYRYGCTVRNMLVGPTSDPFALSRLTIRHSTTMPAFHQIVNGSIPMTLWKNRALTRGWAVVRRARATLSIAASAK